MRYLLFGSEEFYYARGGAHDFLGSAGSVNALSESEILKEDIVWWHVFDTETRQIVARSECQAYGVLMDR